MIAEAPEPQPPESTPSQPTTADNTYQIKLSDISAVQAIAEAPSPAILYHYTTRQPLLDIVTTRTLYASNIRYLNDSQELELAIKLMKEIIDDTDLRQHDVNNDFKDWAGTMLYFVERYDSFVSSFSENGDDLSQWRAYSGKTDGYAIGFTSSDLVLVRKPQTLFLAKCIYEEEEHREQLRSIFMDAHNKLTYLIRQGQSPQDARDVAVTMFVGGFFVIAPTIKHRAFMDEKEWRLIYPVFNVSDKKVGFRNSGTMLVPYRRIKIAIKSGEEISLPIATVVIGPHPHMDLEERAISGLLAVNGIPNVKIIPSEIPYRNW